MSDLLKKYGQVFINEESGAVILVDLMDGTMLTPPFFEQDDFGCSATEHLELFVNWLNEDEGATAILTSGDGMATVHAKIESFNAKIQEAIDLYSEYKERVPLRRLDDFWDVIQRDEDVESVVSMWLREAECDYILEELDPTDLSRRLTFINGNKSVMGSIAYDQPNTLKIQLEDTVLFLQRNDDTTYNLTVKNKTSLARDANVLAAESNVPIPRLSHQVTMMFEGLNRGQSVKAKTPKL